MDMKERRVRERVRAVAVKMMILEEIKKREKN